MSTRSKKSISTTNYTAISSYVIIGSVTAVFYVISVSIFYIYCPVV
jgi:hypothetical protein